MHFFGLIFSLRRFALFHILIIKQDLVNTFNVILFQIDKKYKCVIYVEIQISKLQGCGMKHKKFYKNRTV